MQRQYQSPQVKRGNFNILTWKTFLLSFLIFAVVSIVIYSPSMKGDFAFDDKIIKYNYGSIIHINSLFELMNLLFSQEHSRKIGLMSFSLNYYCGKLDPFGYHLVNVIVHILNGLILLLSSYTILTLPSVDPKGNNSSFNIAFLGSLLWLVHPIQTQSVSYIVQRLTSLTALFYLLSLVCYIKGRLQQTLKRIALFVLSFLFGLLALGTKQNAATLPLFIILIECLFLQERPFKIGKSNLKILLLFGGLFILIAGIYAGPDFITKIVGGYEKRGWTPLERILTQFRVVVLYLSLLIYPHPSRLNVDHDVVLSTSLFTPVSTFYSLLFVIVSVIPAIFFLRRMPLVSFAIIWFFGNLIIESSIIPLALVFEHRLYLPSMSLLILFVGLCVRIPKKEWGKWINLLLVLLILFFSYWTYERAFVWRGPVSLWSDAIEKSPQLTRPHYKLGAFYLNQGRLDKAIKEYEQIIEINPELAEAHNNLGSAYSKKGMFDEAISEFKKALAIFPDYAKAHKNLGAIYGKQGRLNEAIAEFKKALTINPNYGKAHFSLGGAYYYLGEYKLALIHFDEASKLGIKINPKILKFLESYR